METKKVKNLHLIAERVPPGDRWQLRNPMVDHNFIHPSLTDALEAWFGHTGEKVDFQLSPLTGKLYAITEVEEEVKPEPIKQYNLYGDPIK